MARSSAYGQMISQLPNWVLKGEFGDISNLLNNREQEYEQTQNAQLINDLNQMKLEEQQRQADFEEELRRRDIFGGNSDEPLTLRDMYGRVRDVAQEMGNVDYILKMEEQLQKLQEAQAKEERQKLLQGRDDQEWEWKVENRKKGQPSGAPSNEAGYWMKDPEGNEWLIPKSQVNDKVAEKWKRAKSSDNPLAELLRDGDQGDAPTSDAAKPAEAAIQEQKALTKEIGDQAAGTVKSGDVAPRDMIIRDKATGRKITIRKGEIVP